MQIWCDVKKTEVTKKLKIIINIKKIILSEL